MSAFVGSHRVPFQQVDRNEANYNPSSSKCVPLEASSSAGKTAYVAQPGSSSFITRRIISVKWPVTVEDMDFLVLNPTMLTALVKQCRDSATAEFVFESRDLTLQHRVENDPKQRRELKMEIELNLQIGKILEDDAKVNVPIEDPNLTWAEIQALLNEEEELTRKLEDCLIN